MSERGHLVRSRALGMPLNRTLVRDVVRILLQDPHAPAYVTYVTRQRRMVATATRPIVGIWRQVGPYDLSDTTLLTLTREVEYAAQECREAARAG